MNEDRIYKQFSKPELVQRCLDLGVSRVALLADNKRLRAEVAEARKPDCRTCVYYYMPLRSCGARNGCAAGDAYSPASAPVRLYEKEVV